MQWTTILLTAGLVATAVVLFSVAAATLNLATTKPTESEQLAQIGGAKIGWINFGWPLARLGASPGLLTIQVRFLLYRRTYSFTPQQTSTIERRRAWPGHGIRVRHTRPDYPRSISFGWIGNPNVIIEALRHCGFDIKQ